MTSKTDNHDPIAKLALRRYFLEKYHNDGSARVLDCCMGSGLLWKSLRLDHPVAKYVGLDVKPKKGRLKIDSVRYLDAGGWDHDVIDIDTYGSPWKHWFAVLAHVSQPTTVFLTIGQRVTGTVGSLAKECFDAMGLGGIRPRLPKGFHPKLAAVSTSYCLAKGCRFGIMECVESESHNRNVRYIGVRLDSQEPQEEEDLCH
jgi:hypothetical protein